MLQVSDKAKSIILYFFTAFIVFLVFSPCLHAGFINFDDPLHVLVNPAVIKLLSISTIKAIFIQTVNGLYIPLTTLSFVLEHYFFGFNAFVFHLDNLLLHVAVVLVVLSLGRRMGLSAKASFLAALIFGINPMKVESVAWVTERKDVLYSLFYILAIHRYWSYLKTKTAGHYLRTLLFGFLSMLTKPMALSLPLVLFLLDWFTRRRWDKNVFIEKVPFFLYTAELGSLSYLFHMRNPITDMPQAALIWLWSLSFYFLKFLWPFHVSFVYILPHPITLTNWSYLASVGIFILIVWALIRWRHNRFFVFAFGFYFLCIFFLLRFDDKVDFTVVSDRFMYLPCLGLCIGLAAGLEKWLRSKNIIIIFLIFSAILGVRSFQQCKIWQDSLSFWNVVVREHPTAPSSYYYRGMAYIDLKKYDLALTDFSKAIDLNPGMSEVRFDRAVLEVRNKDYSTAMADLSRVIDLNPDMLNARIARAALEERNKDFFMATKDYLVAQNLSGESFAEELSRVQKEMAMANVKNVSATLH